eukprot:TRINITY_DN4036_c0_g1_i1.p1 TRINITY_DN4036_c0_g1~~TRINITY_DN4036_c0_g1_i1.p1  ORF type:complete len:317 (-),score=14.33 TRINITY_DN4036_c0_g1_i1:494-1444(-)
MKDSPWIEITNTDVFGVICAFFGWPIARYLSSQYIFQPLAERYVHIVSNGKNGNSNEKTAAAKKDEHEQNGVLHQNGIVHANGKDHYGEEKEEKQLREIVQQKFVQSLWTLSAYVILFSLGMKASYGQPWFYDTRYLYEGWPNHDTGGWLRLLYITYFGFMTSSFWMLITWDVRRKDFWAFFVHHILTSAVIILSFSIKFLRGGSMMLLAHDIGDILLEASKLSKYSGLETLASILFVVFTLQWLVLRLGYFPFILLGSTFRQLPEIVGYFPPLAHVIQTFLIIIVVIHVYWFGLILKVLYNAVVLKKIDDVREED